MVISQNFMPKELESLAGILRSKSSNTPRCFPIWVLKLNHFQFRSCDISEIDDAVLVILNGIFMKLSLTAREQPSINLSSSRLFTFIY